MSRYKSLLLSLLLSGCSTAQPVVEKPAEVIEPVQHVNQEVQPENTETPLPARDPACPADADANELLPGMTEDLLNANAWNTNRKVVMTQKAITKQNARFYAEMSDLDTPVPKSMLEDNLRARLKSFREKFEKEEIMFEDGTRPDLSDFERPLNEFLEKYSESELSQYILLEDATILCGPHPKPYIKTQNGEVRFSRNNCSLGRAQSRIEVIFTDSNGMRFVRTRDMWGWLAPDVKLSPMLTDKTFTGENDGRWFIPKPANLAGMDIPKGAFLAGTGNDVVVATPDGAKHLKPSEIDGIIDTHRNLTRADWINTLFLFLGDPYGWGGHGGYRDCSRLILDTARSFNLWLPRNSKEQAVQTSYYLHVAGMAPEDKLKKIKDAARTGIVLLHFPGHIMAYVGEKSDGTPIIMHALSEYIQACPDGITNSDGSAPESLTHVDRIVLSDLSLGADTTRTSFLERITHISVLTEMTRDAKDTSNMPWRSTHEWTPEEETLFSAFVERLFNYTEEPDKSWTNLADVLRDPKHNILYNALGEHEDDHLKLRPDCADLPYMLRAYFAWKRGLPMASRKCSRGTNKKAPKCGEPMFETEAHYQGTASKRFNSFAVHIGGYRVHSGNARTDYDDDSTDFYPVPLDRDSLRPGTIYADPSGHLFVIAHYTPDTKETPGAMLAVDAQPDGTITRKRFWRGNFLFDPRIENVGAGFKAFRPIRNGAQLTNAELNQKSGFVPYSHEQGDVSKDVFYDRVEAAIHPKPLSIEDGVAELVNALRESGERRVAGVQNGDDYVREHGTGSMVMPNGYAVFETTGPWEDFATPSRDMRILIAIDAVRDYPQQIQRNADRYGLKNDAEIAQAVQKAKDIIAESLNTQTMTYQNSQGNPVTLTLTELVNRAEALEVGYHPADCNEIRWGAPENSEEIKTCSRRASASEHQKLEQMRPWFAQRMRPAR